MTRYGQITRLGLHLSALFLLSLTAVLAVHAQDEKITAEELISRHLESIGPAEARQQLETRTFVGEGLWRMFVGGVGQISGQASIVSSKDTCDIKFDTRGNTAFFGERFSFDGEHTFVKRAFQSEYSHLGRFMQRNTRILDQGLLGGTASLSWVLQDVAGRRAKVRYRGLKDVDERLLHRLDYRPRKGSGNLKIELYFEPETYRHVRTEYRDDYPAGIGAAPDPSRSAVPGSPRDPTISRMQHTRVSLIETFDNFQLADGVMVPLQWKLRLDIYKEGRSSTSPSVSEIEVNFQEIHHNAPSDVESLQSR